jgi:hypothetical protein
VVQAVDEGLVAVLVAEQVVVQVVVEGLVVVWVVGKIQVEAIVPVVVLVESLVELLFVLDLANE